MASHEINFDGIVGPTHNYAGLSYGNVASMSHKKSISNPRRAALEGLAKMKFLMDLGIRQAVLPPQDRPHPLTLRKLGFSGSDAEILDKAYRADPALLAAVSSASAMWTANAATVSPSADTADHRVHFTPANLISQFHRSIETEATTRTLRALFADESAFCVHDTLPPATHFSDEGAANHTRLCHDFAQPGIELFTFGRSAFDLTKASPRKFPARQTLEACQSIARSHLLDPARAIFVQQNPEAIDAGAFHNDVVAVGTRDVLFFHERAFVDLAVPYDEHLHLIEVAERDVPLAEAVSTYLFNSQLVILADESMALIAPIECRENPRVYDYIQKIIAADNPIRAAHFVDVRQSMHNGGGPACLRLRIVLNDLEIAKLRGNVLLTDSLHQQLKGWIEKHYRDELFADDLRDPQLLRESRDATSELSHILQLSNLYI